MAIVVGVSKVFAKAEGKAIEGRAARLAFIEMFNNVCDVTLVRAAVAGKGTVDGYAFRGTSFAARGVARLGGLTVYHVKGDLFVAANLAADEPASPHTTYLDFLGV